MGYDMLKQRGGWQVLGKTPSDSSLDFNNLFDHEVEDLSKSLTDDVGMNEDKARLLACNEFQVGDGLILVFLLNPNPLQNLTL